MTTCGYCKKRKGKRICPVLGSICSPCCGEHRGREIACPPDCPHVRRPDDSLQKAFQKIYAKLAAFVMAERTDWCGPAVEAFLDEARTLSDWEQEAFKTYLALGHRDSNGERGIDLFYRAQGDALSKLDLEVLGYLQDARPSLFLIEEVQRDVGLQLQDMLANRSLFVRERLATHTVERGLLVLAWVTRVRDHYELVAGFTHVPSVHAELAIATIEAEIERQLADPSDIPEDAAFAHVLPAVHCVLRKAIAEYTPPKLLMEDGEELMECRALYEVLDADAVRERLAEHRDVRQTNANEFHWMGKRRGMPMEHRAEIALRTVRLELRALTNTDLVAGKRFLKTLLGNRIRHRADSIKDFPALAGEHREAERPIDPPGRLLAGAANERAAESAPGQTSETDDRLQAGKKRTLHDEDLRMPLMAHEIMKRHVPGIARAAAQAADGLREQWDESRTLLKEDIQAHGQLMAFGRTYAETLTMSSAAMSPDDAASEATLVMQHLAYMTNFMLHRRKVFWVDESLAWMLTQTDLDVPGDLVQLPFPAFALTFTDRATLQLGESLLQDEVSCAIRGQEQQILSVYVVRGEQTGQSQGIHLFLLFDAQAGQWPYLLTRDLFIRPHDNMDTILDSHFPDVSVSELDPVFLAPELKKLVHLVINCILYTTSAHLDPVIVTPRRKRSGVGGRARSQRPLKWSSESVFYLPGKIDISRIRRMSDLEGTKRGRGIMKRFMVRGHWRRAAPGWRDQRLRWIEPYWKGPDIAAIVEKEYRLKL